MKIIKTNVKNMLEIQEKDFKTIINEVKNQISNTQIKIFQNANMSLLKLYYNIRKIISDNSEWGNKFIDEMARELKISFPIQFVVKIKKCRWHLHKFLGHTIC